ncbi:MAG: DUF481 domain-containing protein, partial [Burkholderiales bacterium]|nr:DUF481 domain-containing protein [Burkholderiales bacterium]
VSMINGDRISGRIVGLDATTLTLQTDYAGEVKIALDQIAEADAEAPVTVVMKDGTRLAGVLSAAGGTLRLAPVSAQAPVVVRPAQVSTLEQGIVLVPAWHFGGRITLGISDSSGNSNVTRANASGEVHARRGRSRITAGLRGSYARDSGRDTEGNASANAKYDRFLDDKWYAYGNTSFEYDPFRDLRLRATLGAGSGYQVLDTDRTMLSVEGGLEFVSSQFYEQPDEDFPAARVALRADHWLWKEVVQLFLRTEGYANLETLRRSFVRTQTGLRFPLRNNFLAQAQLNVDWQGDPAPGTDAVDRSVVLSVGYQW